VPCDVKIILESVDPRTTKLRSCPAPVVLTVKLQEAPVESNEIVPPEPVSTLNPPVPDNILTAVAPVLFPNVIVLATAAVPINKSPPVQLPKPIDPLDEVLITAPDDPPSKTSCPAVEITAP